MKLDDYLLDASMAFIGFAWYYVGGGWIGGWWSVGWA